MGLSRLCSQNSGKLLTGMPKSCYLNFESCDRYINVNYFSFFTIITNIGRQEKKNEKIEVFYEIVDLFVLDMCSKPIFCSKGAQKGKICSRLP